MFSLYRVRELRAASKALLLSTGKQEVDGASMVSKTLDRYYYIC